MDPRIERTKQAVRQATLEVLGERGFDACTIEGVAREARVAKSTIYRHWSTKLDLVADALETLNVSPRPQLGAGSAREQVTALLEHLTSAFADSTFSACVPALIEAAERHPEVARFLHAYSARRRQVLVDVIQGGIDTGELPAHVDAEIAALALSGPVIYRRTMTPAPLPPEAVGPLVAQVLGPA